MAEHREGFADDVGGKLLLLAALLAIFGVIALVLMPLGAAFAPPPAAPVAEATASPAVAAPATTTAAPTDTTATPAEVAVTPAEGTPAEAPAGPPPFIAAFFPGIIMLVVAAILGAIAGLFLGFATARAEEAGAAGVANPH